MKLYLSSFRLGNEKDRLVDLAGARRFAFIANALDSSQAREDVVQRGIDDLAQIGLKCDVVDLRKYFTQSAALPKELENYEAFFVTGGNVFVMRRAMAQSGFDEFITSKRDNPDYLYAGYSAGVCVCAPTLRGIDFVDDPKNVPDGYKSEIIWEGLSLIDYSVAPHYRSNHSESQAIDKVVEYFTVNNLPFRAIRDGEVIITELSSFC